MGTRGRHVPDAAHHRPVDICFIHSTLLGAPMNHDGYALTCEKVERPIVDLGNPHAEFVHTVAQWRGRGPSQGVPLRREAF